MTTVFKHEVENEDEFDEVLAKYKADGYKGSLASSSSLLMSKQTSGPWFVAIVALIGWIATALTTEQAGLGDIYVALGWVAFAICAAIAAAAANLNRPRVLIQWIEE